MLTTLKNGQLTVCISTHGAELQNIIANATGHEYLWQGNPAFWGRRSPVLFPIVGSLWNAETRIDGKSYKMSQHGFARDCDFTPLPGATATEAWFRLESSAATLEKFPRRFRLEIGYRLNERSVVVMWRVTNLDSRDMSFQIGAHPAFNYPAFSADEAIHGWFAFDTQKSMSARLIQEKGCVGTTTTAIALTDGLLPIEADTFAHDALIMEGGQTHRVSLLDKEKRPYLTVEFDAPLVGLWSPGHNAPFCCIEPWYGRCDSVGFTGEFADREHVNTLVPGETFSANYFITID